MIERAADAAAVRALRERHGLSQAGLAARCPRVSVRTIQAWESGRQAPHPATWAYVLAQMGELELPEPSA